MTEVNIYQGNQIGGCVTVISTVVSGVTHRIMVDYGASLPGSDTEKDFDYPWNDKPVDAVLFTHYHGDHVGRLMEIPPDIPLYMGDVARRVMINIQEALAKSSYVKNPKLHRREAETLKDDNRVRTFKWNGSYYDHIELEGFTIEPYSIDHSAYDAYMFLIEADDSDKADGKYRILHTGDFRGHGRRGRKMLTLIHTYIRSFGRRAVDALVIEGTMMSRQKDDVPSEYEMQLEAAEYLHDHKYAFLICSSTNVDSLASFYQGAQMAAYPQKRNMYVYSSYLIKQLKLFTETAGKFSDIYRFENVYRIDFDKKLKSGHNWQGTGQDIMEKFGFIALIKPEDFCEKYIDAFVDAYHNKRIEQMPVIIYSMWDGYLMSENKAANHSWIEFLERQKEKGIEVKHMHTSGHAVPKMIADVIKAVDPCDRIYPMHTERVDAFSGLDIGACVKKIVPMDDDAYV